MLCQWLAWDSNGLVIATLDYCVMRDERGDASGLIDFEAHELAGGRMRDIADVSAAAGSGTWPEWLGARAHEFKVELAATPSPSRARIVALVHASGYRRERTVVEAAIAKRRAQTEPGNPVDLRDIVGGPNRPLPLDANGRSPGDDGYVAKPRLSPNLPVIARRG